jgi:hypothetical protein
MMFWSNKMNQVLYILIVITVMSILMMIYPFAHVGIIYLPNNNNNNDPAMMQLVVVNQNTSPGHILKKNETMKRDIAYESNESIDWTDSTFQREA